MSTPKISEILLFKKLHRIEQNMNVIVQALGLQDEFTGEVPSQMDNIIAQSLMNIGDATPTHNLQKAKAGLSIEPVN